MLLRKAKATYPAFLSNGLVSLSGFMWSYYLLHNLSKEEFGKFSVVQAAGLLVAGLFSAALVMPILVRLSQGDSELGLLRLRFYLKNSLAICTVIGLSAALLTFYADSYLLLPAVILGAALVPRDLLVRGALASGTPELSAGPAVFGLLTACLALATVHISNVQLSLHSSIMLLAASTVVIPGVGIDALRVGGGFDIKKAEERMSPVPPVERIYCAAAYIVNWVQAQALIVFVFYVITAESAATIAAARIMVTPFVFSAPVISGLVMRKLSRATKTDRLGVWFAAMLSVGGAGVLLSMILVLIYLTFGDYIYPDQNNPDVGVVIAVVLVSLLQLIRDVSRAVLYAEGQSGAVLKESAVGVLIMLVGFVLVVSLHGQEILGVVWAAVLAEAVFALFLAVTVRASLR